MGLPPLRGVRKRPHRRSRRATNASSPAGHQLASQARMGALVVQDSLPDRLMHEEHARQERALFKTRQERGANMGLDLLRLAVSRHGVSCPCRGLRPC